MKRPADLAGLVSLVLRGWRLAVAAGLFAHHARAVAAMAGNVVFESAQPTSKPLRKLMTRAPQPGLQRVLGHAELFGGFPSGIAFHLTQQKCRPEKRRKLAQVFANHFP